LSLKKSFFLISIVSLAALMLIAGCGPQPTRKYTLSKTNNPIYGPTKNITSASRNHYPEPRPVPDYLPGGSLNNITIIIDPGHGGKDPGAGEHTLSSVPEKTINLAIAKELQIRLKAKGAKVIMSRTGDKFVDLDVRAEMAEQYRADLLVSVHADSNPNRYISGATIYVARGCSYKSSKTARNIQASFTNSNIKCRGVRNQDFRVLAKHSRPAVLVECGFMTNEYEAKMLNSTWYRNKLAAAIANGIANTF